MEPAVVPCGFAMMHLYRNRNHVSITVTDTIIQTMTFASIIAAVGTSLSMTLAWSLVIPPLLIFSFFMVYQKLRAAKREPAVVKIEL